MPSLLHRLIGSEDPRIARLVDSAGRLRDRLDHPQLRDVRRILTGTPDVVLLGESVLDFVGPHDADQRRLPTMVADELGPDVSVLAVHGGGYHAELLSAYVRVLASRPHRPRVVVVALWARGRLLPWITHPRFGHVEAMRRIHELDLNGPTWRVRGSLRKPTAEEFETYYALRYPSPVGDLAVGDYARPLKARQLSEPDRIRLLYAFHHGGRVQSDALVAVTELGRALRGLGCAVVAYETPLSAQTGERVLGSAFLDVVTANFADLRAAFQAGAGDAAVVLETGTAFAEEEFIDPGDGSEHLNERGRRRLAALIADQVRAQYGS